MSHWIMTTSEPCRAELHEWCEVDWCDCSCHPIEEASA